MILEIYNHEQSLARLLPLEAICYAGKWLDREIPEFETLVVEGRGGFERQNKRS